MKKICALLFLEPLARRLARLPARDRSARAIAAETLPANDKRQDYVRARLMTDDAGALLAHPFQRQDSSMMKVFAQADCLIVRPPNAGETKAGGLCEVMVLRQPASTR